MRETRITDAAPEFIKRLFGVVGRTVVRDYYFVIRGGCR
jgi:hypothetical protein